MVTVMKLPLFRAAAMTLLCALILTGGGCSRSPREDGLPWLEDMNVLLIVVDTMGAGHVGCLEPGLDTTPNIDRLAADGALFTHAYSTAPWTQPSISALMTGLTPSHTGVLHLYDHLGADNVTLAERLSRRGFATAGVVSHFLIAARLGFDQGFDSYDESAVVNHHRGISSPKVYQAAAADLQRLKDDRFFMFVHFFDPHAHYLHHPEFDRTSWYHGPVRDWDHKITELRKRLDELDPDGTRYLRDLYREEIAFTDHYIGMLLAKLDELGLRDNTLVILTADHGEEFMEHHWIGHTRNLYDTLVHVPLVVSLPGRIDPAVIDDPVSLLDIAPTLMDLSRDPVEDFSWDGISLIPRLAGRRPGRTGRLLYHEVAFPARKDDAGTPVAGRGTFLAAVSRDQWKLIHDVEHDTWSLFDRVTDPGEHRDLLAEQPAVASPLRRDLLEWEKDKVPGWGVGGAQKRTLDPELEKRLKSLGYIR